MVVLDIRLAKKVKKKRYHNTTTEYGIQFSRLVKLSFEFTYLLKNTACQKMFPPCYCHPILMQIYGVKTSSETRAFQICASF